MSTSLVSGLPHSALSELGGKPKRAPFRHFGGCPENEKLNKTKAFGGLRRLSLKEPAIFLTTAMIG